MKKLIAILFAAILSTAGLVTISAGTAQAACGDQYNPCVTTSAKATGPKNVKVGKKAKIKVSVAPTSGNAPVSGTVKVVVKGKGMNFTKTVNVSGKAVNVPTPKLTKKGTYKVTITFTPAANSNATASKGKMTIRVK